MLYDVYKSVSQLFVAVWNWKVPWSASVQPTIGQVLVYAILAGFVIWFIKDLKDR